MRTRAPAKKVGVLFVLKKQGGRVSRLPRIKKGEFLLPKTTN